MIGRPGYTKHGERFGPVSYTVEERQIEEDLRAFSPALREIHRNMRRRLGSSPELKTATRDEERRFWAQRRQRQLDFEGVREGGTGQEGGGGTLTGSGS